MLLKCDAFQYLLTSAKQTLALSHAGYKFSIQSIFGIKCLFPSHIHVKWWDSRFQFFTFVSVLTICYHLQTPAVCSKSYDGPSILNLLLFHGLGL